MKVLYLPVRFIFKFEKSVYADTYPSFVLRSILGMNLKQICCISRKSECQTCMYNKSCSYATIFETIEVSSNEILPGRNRISHPYTITDNSKFDVRNRKIDKFEFTITLYGKTIQYLPYIYAAFVRGGYNGMFKTREKYVVEDVLVNGKSILLDENTIQNDVLPFSFSYENQSNINENKEILVELKTPLRFKVNGKYKDDFLANDFFACLYRRFKTMMLMYGTEIPDEFPKQSETNLKIEDRNLKWIDYSHYSARQKTAMELGGLIGTLKLVGNISDFELILLDFAKVANAGKNTNFGLGQIDYWIK